MIARPAPLALPAALAPRLDEKYGRRPDPPDDGDAASCDGDGDAASSDGDASSDGGGAFDGDGAPSLRVPLCADGRTAAVALPAEPPPAATHVARVGKADVAAPLEELPAAARAFWAARFTTRDDGARAPRAVHLGGVLLGRVRDARVGELLLAAARLDPSLARADHVAASWLRALLRADGGGGFREWQRRLGDDVAAEGGAGAGGAGEGA